MISFSDSNRSIMTLRKSVNRIQCKNINVNQSNKSVVNIIFYDVTVFILWLSVWYHDITLELWWHLSLQLKIYESKVRFQVCFGKLLIIFLILFDYFIIQCKPCALLFEHLVDQTSRVSFFMCRNINENIVKIGLI